jgi:pimeloyl-ACP methyl ester carboxylesterase
MRVDVQGRAVHAYTGARRLDDRPERMVVFVHGAANDHSVWGLQSRYFAHHGRNAMAVDLPGHGRSDGPALASVDALAEWLEALRASVGAPRMSLVGHSMGALASLEYASRHPDRVDRLALLGPSVPMPVNDVLLDAARRDDAAAFELINAWSHSAARQLGGNRQPGIWMTGQSLRLMQRMRPGVLYLDLMACNAYPRGLDAAAAVRCPVLLILGGRDQMAPARNAAALAQGLYDVRTVTLPASGHAMMSEEPDAVLDALRGFL